MDWYYDKVIKYLLKDFEREGKNGNIILLI